MSDEPKCITLYLDELERLDGGLSSCKYHVRVKLYGYYNDNALLDAVASQFDVLRLYESKDFATELVENYKEQNEKEQKLLRLELAEKQQTIERLEQQLSFLRAEKQQALDRLPISGGAGARLVL